MNEPVHEFRLIEIGFHHLTEGAVVSCLVETPKGPERLYLKTDRFELEKAYLDLKKQLGR